MTLSEQTGCGDQDVWTGAIMRHVGGRSGSEAGLRVNVEAWGIPRDKCRCMYETWW